VFSYDAKSAQVLMASDLWRELSLLGHWIADAVVLRWAELTERFSRRQGIHAGEVLPLLLARAEPERGTHLARQVFAARGVDRCAWSGRKLAGVFAVDHVIPFSLWGNNDLWNLMPAHPKVNGEKSDRLPAGELLVARRASITENWQLLRDALPEPFGKQAAHLVGRAPRGSFDWESELFMRLREAVELTALQRGIERWTGAGAPMSGRVAT
jgi:hypothetical protein